MRGALNRLSRSLHELHDQLSISVLMRVWHLVRGIKVLAQAVHNSAGATSYDEVPYESHPYPQTHPSRLVAVATLFGLRPPNRSVGGFAG
jgi:hypothetical protein